PGLLLLLILLGDGAPFVIGVAFCPLAVVAPANNAAASAIAVRLFIVCAPIVYAPWCSSPFFFTASWPDLFQPHFKSLAQIRRAHADLHDARLVDAGDADIFENLVVDLALARILDDDLLGARDQRPECRGLRLLAGIGAEREVDPGIGQISVPRRIGNPEFLNG